MSVGKEYYLDLGKQFGETMWWVQSYTLVGGGSDYPSKSLLWNITEWDPLSIAPPMHKIRSKFKEATQQILDPSFWSNVKGGDLTPLHVSVLRMILEHDGNDNNGPVLWIRYEYKEFEKNLIGPDEPPTWTTNDAYRDEGGSGTNDDDSGWGGYIPFNFDDLSGWGLFTDDSIGEVKNKLLTDGSIEKIMSNKDAVRGLFPNAGMGPFIWHWMDPANPDNLSYPESKRIFTRRIEQEIQKLGIKRDTKKRVDDTASRKVKLPKSVFNRVCVMGKNDMTWFEEAADVIDIFDISERSYEDDLRPHLLPGFMGMAEEYSNCSVPTSILQGKGIGDPNTLLRLINQQEVTIPESMIELYPETIDPEDPTASTNGDLLVHLWALGEYQMGGADDATDDYTDWVSKSLDHSFEGFTEWVDGFGDFLFGLFVDQPTIEEIHKRLYSRFIMELITWNTSEPELQGEEADMQKNYGYTPEDFFQRIFFENAPDEKISGYNDIRQRSVGEKSWLSTMVNLILHELETQRRIGAYDNLCDDQGNLKPDIDPDGGLDSEAVREASADGGSEAMEGAGGTEDVEDDESLTEDEIEERQKFFKQCALMINAHKLKQQLRKRYTKEWAEMGKNPSYKPYQGRFWMAGCNSDQERLINNLISSEDGKEFFNVPPAILSYLVPKLRLFKVENDDNKSLTDTEFVFSQHVDLNREKNYSRSDTIQNSNVRVPSSYLSADFDKGDGCGVKDFSLSFEGSTPATSRTDIKGKLQLYFQSFADLLRERISYNGRPYRYIDLILQPKADEEKGTVNGIEITHPNQYDPSFYRIRAEVGYNPLDENPPINFQGWTSEQWVNLNQAILRTNRAYYLCMVDHDINVNNDGTVNVTISYQAYVETAMKSLRFDALTTRELLKARKEGQKTLKKMIEEEKCTNRQINKFKEMMNVTEEELRKQSLRSILTRLLIRDKIYGVKINKKHAQYFRANGFFGSCELKTIAGDKIPDALKISDIGLDVVTKGLANSELADALEPDMPEDIDYTDKKDVTINFFFFGDLLHTILDCSYETDGLVPGMENTKILLGSLDFSTFLRKDKSEFINPIINLAEIPISVDYFMQWFTENVIQEGETRKSFPIIYFVRNMCNTLLKTSLLENCVHRRVETNLRFQTGQISAFSPDGQDPFGKLVGSGEWIVNTDLQRRADNLPLLGDANQELRDLAGPNGLSPYYYNYLVVNVIGSSLTYTGRGKYIDDVRDGRYHIDIGSNRGIVKTVKFAKTDIQYLREARFMRQGIDGLQQLANVYKADIEMYGNSLFYPGMELYINPYGIGGTELGSPTQGPMSRSGRSLANTLGVGGYHTIISVKSSLSRGKYTTNIGAQWYYSGDGQPPPGINGAISAPSTKDIESGDMVFPEDSPCKNLYLQGVDSQMAIESNPYLGMDETGVNNIENLPPDLTQLANTEGYSDVANGGSSTVITNPDGSSYNLSFKDDDGNMYTLPYDTIIRKESGAKEYWFEGQKSGVVTEGFDANGDLYTQLEILQGKDKGKTIRSTFIETVPSEAETISGGPGPGSVEETSGGSSSSSAAGESENLTEETIGDQDVGDSEVQPGNVNTPEQTPMSNNTIQEEKIVIDKIVFDLKDTSGVKIAQKDYLSTGKRVTSYYASSQVQPTINIASAAYDSSSGEEYKDGIVIKNWCPGDLGVASMRSWIAQASLINMQLHIDEGSCEEEEEEDKLLKTSKQNYNYLMISQHIARFEAGQYHSYEYYRTTEDPVPWKIYNNRTSKKVTVVYEDGTEETIWKNR